TPWRRLARGTAQFGPARAAVAEQWRRTRRHTARRAAARLRAPVGPAVRRQPALDSPGVSGIRHGRWATVRDAVRRRAAHGTWRAGAGDYRNAHGSRIRRGGVRDRQ